MTETGIYKCPKCGRQWRWYREPIIDFPLVCPDCSRKEPGTRLVWIPTYQPTDTAKRTSTATY